MLLPNSRYKTTPAFNPSGGGDVVLPGLRPRPVGPASGVVEHVIREGERLDHLARHYYNDDRLWWRILDANPQIVFGGGLMPVEDPRVANDTDSLVGQTLLIPRAQEV